MSDLASNLARFKISFMFILARWAKMNRKRILKCPRFVQFCGNLPQFEVKSNSLFVRYYFTKYQLNRKSKLTTLKNSIAKVVIFRQLYILHCSLLRSLHEMADRAIITQASIQLNCCWISTVSEIARRSRYFR